MTGKDQWENSIPPPGQAEVTDTGNRFFTLRVQAVISWAVRGNTEHSEWDQRRGALENWGNTPKRDQQPFDQQLTESLRTGMVTSKQVSMIDRQWLKFISDKMVSVHLSTSQTLMRYISEWDPRKAKWPWCVVFNRWFLKLLIMRIIIKFIKLNFASQRGSAHQGRLSGGKHLTASFSGDTQVGVTVFSHTYLILLTNWRWQGQVGNPDLACRWCGPRGCRNPSHSASCCQDWQG